MINITWSDPVDGENTKSFKTIDEIFEVSPKLGIISAYLPKKGSIVVTDMSEPWVITIVRV